MNEGGWRFAPVAPPAPGQLRAFALGERNLLVCNVDGDLYAIDDRCPHAGIALSDGALRGCVLECPLHGGKLDVRSGAPVAPPIRRRVEVFAARRDGTGIAVRLR